MSKLISPDTILSSNGDRVVQMITKEEFDVNTSPLQDLTTVAKAFGRNQDTYHLGMLQTFEMLGQTMRKTNYVPQLMMKMLKNRAIIELNHGYNKFTYSTPITRYSGLEVAADTTEQEAGLKPGLGESVFPLKLNKPMRIGDRMSYDVFDGIQVIVSNERDIEQKGGYWVHWVKIIGGHQTTYFPLDKLKQGVEYFKIGHGMGEFSEDYSSTSNQFRNEELLQEFSLGNHMGVSVKSTLYGGEVDSRNIELNPNSSLIFDSIAEDMHLFQSSTNRPYDMLLMTEGVKVESSGSGINIKRSKENTTVMTLFEAMSVAELTRMEMTNMLFSNGGTIQEHNGQILTNEGFYTQLKRGYIQSYAVAGGLEIEDLQTFSDSVFRHNYNMTDDDRELTIWAGRGLKENIEYIKNQYGQGLLNNPTYMTLMGADRQIPKSPITGDLKNLEIQDIKFGKVKLPGVGWINCIHDESLDYQPGKDRFSNRVSMTRGENRSTYMGYLDVRDTTATNVFSDPNLRNAKAVEGEFSLKNSSLFYVRPKRSIHWGWEVGRMNSVSYLSEQCHVSSSKEMASEFWMHVRSACVILDKSGTFVLELEKPRVTRVK